MKGYKVFNGNWTCRGFKYEVGKVYEMEESPECCRVGFHFCKKLKDCFNYYTFDPNNKVALVEALGEIDENYADSKVCTNKIKIVEELTWHDVLDLVNTGNYNTGYNNTGNGNSGNCNVGCWNTGDLNTGNNNFGHGNSGINNTGNRNTRDNTGNNNTGGFNSGSFNPGYYNSGNNNTGSHNIGYKNTGDFNLRDWNTGSHNIGSHNTGDFNLSNWNTGCFNTKEQKMYMFDKESNMTRKEWGLSNARRILQSMPTDRLVWIKEFEMTPEEKEDNPTYKTTRGYLKSITVTDKAKQEWYNNLKEEDKREIKNMPNFDADIFKGITGIDVTETKEV